MVRQLSINLEKEIGSSTSILKKIVIVEYQDNIKTSLIMAFKDKFNKEEFKVSQNYNINQLFLKIVADYLDSNDCLLIIDNIRHNSQIDDLINNKINQLKARIVIASNVEACIDNFINYKLNCLKDDDYINIFYNNYKKDKIKLKLKEIINRLNDNIYSIILLAKYAKEYKITIPKLLTMLDTDPISLILKSLNKSEILTLANLYIIEKSHSLEKSEKSNLISNNLINKYNSNIIKNVDKLVKLGLVYIEDDIYFIPTSLKEKIKREFNPLFSEYKNNEYKELIITIVNELEALEKDFFDNVIEKNIGYRLEYINIANNLVGLFEDKNNENNNRDSLEIFNLIKTLAKIYGDLNYNYEALNYYRKAVKIGEKVFGRDTFDLSKIYDSISYIYKKIKNYKKSIEWTIKSININQKNIDKKNDEKSIELANKYSNLCECYIGLNNYNKALYYMNKVLHIRKTSLGDNSYDTIKTYNNIGIIYQELGDYSKALKYYKKALEIKEVVFGKKSEKHIEKAITYNNIGVAYKYKKDYNRALEFFEKAIKIRKKIKEDFSTECATIYYNIGVLYYSKKKVNEALEMLIKAVSIYKKILGNNEITAATYNDIANIYSKDKKNYKNALKLYLKAAFIYLKMEKSGLIKKLYEKITKIDSIIGNQKKDISKMVKKRDKTSTYIDKIFDEYKNIPNKDHKNISYIYNTLATLYYNKGKFLIALDYYKEALSVLEEFVNANPEKFSSINNIGIENNSNSTNESEEIDDILKKFATDNSNTEIEHTTTNEYEEGYFEIKDFLEKIAITNNNIGVVCNSLGYYEEAIKHFEKALGHSDSRMSFFRLKVYNNIGISLMYIKKYSQAIDCFNKILNINTEDKLDNDIRLKIAETYHNIGVCYRLMSNPNKAIQFLNKATKMRNELFDSDDISSAKLINNLAVANTYLKEYKEAERMLIKAIEIYEKMNPTHPELASLSSNLLNLYHKHITPTNKNLNKYYKLVFDGIYRKYS